MFGLQTGENESMYTAQSIKALCPSCGCDATFTYGGEQVIPEKVSQATGLPTSISLWHCGCCHTTRSSQDLKMSH